MSGLDALLDHATLDHADNTEKERRDALAYLRRRGAEDVAAALDLEGL
jgi:hypothetical protein